MMGKKNKSGDFSTKTNEKLDKLLEKFEESESKAERRHDEIKKKLKSMEEKYEKLKIEVKKCKKREHDLEIEMSRMIETVNSLEQDKLSKNLVFKGIKETKKESINNSNYTLGIVQYIVNYLFKVSNKIKVVAAKRIGIVRDKNKQQKRPIVAQFSSYESKMDVLRAAKEASLNCNLILEEDGPIGTVEDKIYVNEHLTQLNTTLHFEARKMKREKYVKFAWVKNGAVLVKKSEDSMAIRIKSMHHLSSVKKRLGIKTIINSTVIERHGSSDSESDKTYEEDEGESSSSETSETPSARGQKRQITPKTDEREPRRPRRAATSKIAGNSA